MKEYVIDGLFLTQRITGTQRYASELTLELDKLIEDNSIEILVPEKHGELPNYQNIKVVSYGKHSGIPWQQIDLPHYLRKNLKQGLFLNNVLPLIYPYGIVALHDVGYKAMPEFYSGFRDKLSAMWHRLNYWRAAHSKMEIVTVSCFSKSEIMKYYHIFSEKSM